MSLIYTFKITELRFDKCHQVLETFTFNKADEKDAFGYHEQRGLPPLSAVQLSGGVCVGVSADGDCDRGP